MLDVSILIGTPYVDRAGLAFYPVRVTRVFPDVCMSDEKMVICPACSKRFATRAGGRGRRRVWCSGACRKWVSAVGGPLGAAQLKQAWADDWARLGNEVTARTLRIEARRLRGLAAKP